MTLDEAIKYCEDVSETNKGIAENYKKVRPYEDGWDFWEKESKTFYEIADLLKELKAYKEEKIIKKAMTYGEIYDEFCKKFPNAEVSDYRPAMPQYLPRLVKPIPYGIVVWLKDGSSMIYIAEEAKE